MAQEMKERNEALLRQEGLPIIGAFGAAGPLGEAFEVRVARLEVTRTWTHREAVNAIRGMAGWSVRCGQSWSDSLSGEAISIDGWVAECPGILAEVGLYDLAVACFAGMPPKTEPADARSCHDARPFDQLDVAERLSARGFRYSLGLLLTLLLDVEWRDRRGGKLVSFPCAGDLLKPGTSERGSGFAYIHQVSDLSKMTRVAMLSPTNAQFFGVVNQVAFSKVGG